MKISTVEIFYIVIVRNDNVYEMVVLKMFVYAIGKNTGTEVPNNGGVLEVDQRICCVA